jgi:hypothetical protein
MAKFTYGTQAAQLTCSLRSTMSTYFPNTQANQPWQSTASMKNITSVTGHQIPEHSYCGC